MENQVMKLLIVPVGLMFLAFFGRCVSDAPSKFKSSTVPEQLNDVWEVASPEDVNISPEALDKVYAEFISEDRYFNAKSLLVVKNGKLVF
jgi:hypothetical protein